MLPSVGTHLDIFAYFPKGSHFHSFSATPFFLYFPFFLLSDWLCILFLWLSIIYNLYHGLVSSCWIFMLKNIHKVRERGKSFISNLTFEYVRNTIFSFPFIHTHMNSMLSVRMEERKGYSFIVLTFYASTLCTWLWVVCVIVWTSKHNYEVWIGMYSKCKCNLYTLCSL